MHNSNKYLISEKIFIYYTEIKSDLETYTIRKFITDLYCENVKYSIPLYRFCKKYITYFTFEVIF